MKFNTAFALLVTTMTIDSQFDVVVAASVASEELHPRPTRKTNVKYNKKAGSTSSGVTEDDFLRPFEFKNQCSYDITVRGALGTGSQDCIMESGTNCFNVQSGNTVTELLPKVKGAGKTIYFSTKLYTEMERATKTSCQGQAFCSALEIYDGKKGTARPRSIFNFDNQYSYGIPIGLSYNDNDGPIQDCPESNLDVCNANPSWCYSTKGRSDNCYHNAMDTCPTDAWKVKTHPDDPVVWCLTNDSTLGVISALQDNTPADCPPAPSDWVTGSSLFSSGEPLCGYNRNLHIAAQQFLSNPGLVLVEGDYPYTPLNRANANMVITGRPGGAKKFQAAVNAGCGQFATQKIRYGSGSFDPLYEPSGRHVVAGNKRKDHASTYEGDQIYLYTWDKMPSSSDRTPMMAGNVGIQCLDQNFDKVKKITVTFCPTKWESW